MDDLTPEQIDVLYLKGMLVKRPLSSIPFETDYEPEQKYGSAHDYREHLRFGGTRDNY